MATQPLGHDSPAVTLPGAITPMPALARVLARFDRDQLGNAIEVMLTLLDLQDGDPDTEDDDPSGQYDEDAYTGPRAHKGGPGCPISDPDACSAGDDGCGWHSLGGHSGWGSPDEDGDVEGWRQPVSLNPD